MDESVNWIVGLVIAFLGISLGMLGTGVSLYYQSESLIKRGQSRITLSRKLRSAAIGWAVGGFLCICMVVGTLIAVAL